MKKIVVALHFLLPISVTFAQKSDVEKLDSISNYFEEIKNSTGKAVKMWNKDLYGSILMVNPDNRVAYSNEPDALNNLTMVEGIYTGKLPDSVNIANTSMLWNRKQWAMIMLPLPENKYDRINLLAHELFHRSQSSLGFIQNNQESNHLDRKDGRIYLRLELEALKKAVLSKSKKEQKEHLTNAFVFRKYRNALFPRSASIENQLELNEGLAEYTGMMISGRKKEQAKRHFIDDIDTFFKNPTYVRSFAYNTTPVYGYLLSFKDRYWNQKIKKDTDLTDFFITNFALIIPNDLKSTAEKIENNYNATSIFLEEEAREVKIKKQVAKYISKFIEQPHFELKFEKMNVSFDPRNMIPIEDKGTVYPSIRVTDNWGILEVKNGALMSPNWDKITVSFPLNVDGQNIEGDGWTLQLTNNYTIKKDEQHGNYILLEK